MNSKLILRALPAGWTGRLWAGGVTDRLYLQFDGKDAGYITELDDGALCTCMHVVEKHRETIRLILRALRGGNR